MRPKLIIGSQIKRSSSAHLSTDQGVIIQELQSDIGIAMSRGTEIAAHSASINLMRDDLRLIPEAIAISRRTMRVISQNLGWAFLYNIVGIYLAIIGALNPLIAASAMLVSSLSVVGNSMRLRHGKGKTLPKILEILIPWREP